MLTVKENLRIHKPFGLAAIIPLLAVALSGCSSPTRRADSLAAQLGFHKAVVQGDGFRHVIYENAKPVRHGTLHVYLDGDGTPYARVTTPATDPTPRNPLMLRLMALDSAGSIYIARPCYFELQRDNACDPALWTTARYGSRVLSSMAAVVRGQMIERGAGRLEIFGLSGGGVIAVLLAREVAANRVVTLGANLDIDAWCDLHHYSRLGGSLNPVHEPPVPAGVDVLHLVGALDTNTPPELVQAAGRQRSERVQVVAHADHGCCWEALWPSVLEGAPKP
jgi:hypothetical protein